MITAKIKSKRDQNPCTKCFKCNYPMIENKCGKFTRGRDNANKTSRRSQANTTLE